MNIEQAILWYINQQEYKALPKPFTQSFAYRDMSLIVGDRE